LLSCPPSLPSSSSPSFLQREGKRRRSDNQAGKRRRDATSQDGVDEVGGEVWREEGRGGREGGREGGV
jgi:hypothetical protein